MITRLDEDLYRRLKEQAAAGGRWMNALVTEVLRSALSSYTEADMVRARADAHGLRIVLSSQPGAPSRDAAIAQTRGAGRAGSRALEEDRGAR